MKEKTLEKLICDYHEIKNKVSKGKEDLQNNEARLATCIEEIREKEKILEVQILEYLNK